MFLASAKRFRLAYTAVWALAYCFLPPRGYADDAAAQQPNSKWVAIPSGIADADSQTIYVTGTNELLTAFDLTTGGQRWEASDAQLALAIVGNQIIARTSQTKLPPNAMQIVVLDAATGKLQKRCCQIVFPEWVAVGGGLGLSFDAAATVQNNILTLNWHAARQLAIAQGKPTPEMIAAAKKTATGTVYVNLETGKYEVQVDPTPQRTKMKRELPFYDVGNERLNVTQRMETVDAGVQLVHRTLEARDQKTGRPLWRQPIVGEVYLPVSPQSAVGRRPTTRAPARR